MLWVERDFLDGKASPAIIFDLHLIFGVHGVFFPIHVRLIQQRIDKKVSKSVQSLWEILRLDIKKIVGVIRGGVGIRPSAMFFYEGKITVGFWVLFCTDEQHVLKKMREPWSVLWVVKAAPEGDQCRGRFISTGVRNQQ